MLRLLQAGLAIQTTSALTLIAQNLLVPRIIGAEAFGGAVAALALPLLMQGLMEAMLVGAAINARTGADWMGAARTIGRDGILFGSLILTILALTCGLRGECTTTLAVALFWVLAVLNTVLRAYAYAEKHDALIVRHYYVAFAVTCLAIPLLAGLGRMGFILTLCAVQVGILGVMLSHKPMARLIASVATRPRQRGFPARHAVQRSYLPSLMPRLATLTLSAGLLVIASWQMKPAALAEYRVTMTVVSAMNYLVPVSAPMLQAHFRHFEDRAVLRFIGIMALVLAGLSAVAVLLFVYANTFLELILGRAAEARFRILLLAGPAFALAPVIASMLLAKGMYASLVVSSVALSVVTVGAGLLWGADAAFVGAAIGFLVLSLALLGIRLSDKGTKTIQASNRVDRVP